MSDSGLIAALVALHARRQQFVSRVANVCAEFKPKELYDYLVPGGLAGIVAGMEHTSGRGAVAISWPFPREEPAVKTITLEDITVAKRAAELWARMVSKV